MDAEQFQVFMNTLTNTLSKCNIATSPTLSLDSYNDDIENFEIFIKRLENYFNINEITKENKKKELLIHCIGAKTLQLLINLVSPEKPESKTYEELKGTLMQHLMPLPNEIGEQHRFSRRIQSEGESIAEFVAELKKLSKYCNFTCSNCKASTNNCHLRLQFISGLQNTKILERLLLLKQSENTFQSCLEIAKNMETVQKDSLEIRKSNIVEPIGQVNSREYQNYNKVLVQKCYRCGNPKHLANKCIHKNSFCAKCNKIGHLQNVCRSDKYYQHRQNTNNTNAQRSRQNQFDERNEEFHVTGHNSLDNDTHYVNSVSSTVLPECIHKPNKFMLDVTVDDIPFKFELDTGAAVSSISENTFRRLLPSKALQYTDLPLRTYTGERIYPKGYATVEIKYKNQQAKVNLYVIANNVDAIFGREWLQQFDVNMPKLNQLHDNFHSLRFELLQQLKLEFPDVFLPGVGKIRNFKASLPLRKDANPIYKPARNIPFALRDKINTEIDRLENVGVISKIAHSEWGTPIVPIIKPDQSVRLCADYKITLNKLLFDDHYPIPNIEEILTSTMMGGKYFSKIDIRQAYMHMPVTDESAIIQTITTPKGDYKVNRLMFGIKNAPAIWQRYITQTLHDIPGVCVFYDDIRIQGGTYDIHKHRVREVIKRLQNAGLRINEEKSQFCTNEIEYLGFKITSEGIKKTDKKVNAVSNAPRPHNISTLKAWLGLVNYYGRFIKNLSSNLYPLYRLLKKNVEFRWSPDCEHAFNLVKLAMISDNILCPFQPELPLILATDASPYGLGAVLSHKLKDGSERPIAYASRTLSDSERNYSQIDKEATAIFWGLNHFFYYCYGRKFTLITDNKPLASIFKPDSKLPKLVATRMLHYAQFLQTFDYNVVTKSTEQHGNADGLSRLPLISKVDYSDAISMYQTEQIHCLPVSFNDIVRETRKDNELRQIYECLVEGKALQIPGYINKEHEFSLNQGCILKGSRVVVPISLRNNLLATLHEGHIGIVKMKSLARSYIWWPKIDENIELLAKQCRSCAQVQNENAKVTVHPWEFPSAPWRRLHVDFAGPFLQKYFLILVDAHSKWPEVIPMNTITSNNTIEHLRNIFSRFGLPLTLVSDNASTFTSNEFQLFLKSNGIQHKLSAPYHPQSNGQAERYVQTVKNALKKVMTEPGTLNLKLNRFLLQYRKTPNATTGISPSMLLQNRDIRTTIDMVKPNIVERIRENQVPPISITYREFNCGDYVMARAYNNECKWMLGRVVRRDGLMHYHVSVNGKLWRRHVDQLKATAVVNENQHETASLGGYYPHQGNDVPHNEVRYTEEEERSTHVPEPSEGQSTDVPDPSGINPVIDSRVVSELPPLRRSVRVRRPPERLHF